MKICQKLVVLSAAWTVVHGKALWSSTAVVYSNIIRTAYPVGNGKLGAMPHGSAGTEKVNLNVDSLWSGGPFASTSYNGGNPTSSKAGDLPGIRSWIFKNSTGNVTALLGSGANYGSYSVLGNLSVVIDGVTSGTGYNRSLDLTTGLHTTVYTSGGKTYTSTVYCSYPDQVCVYNLASTGILPKVTISLENLLIASSLITHACGSGYASLTGTTQASSPVGMKFTAIAKLTTASGASSCSGNSLIVPASSTSAITIVIGAGTDYDQTKGNSANSFSFKGVDPASGVSAVTTAAAAKAETTIRQSHVTDYESLASVFELDLPDKAASSGLETSTIVSRYVYTGAGDPFLESLLLAYGRHLYISSSRANSLPPGLQGRWTQLLAPSWGADFHSNINFQMNHWGVDQTGLGALQVATWNYIQNTWVPRGTLTAQLLYGATSGWVTHDEMNAFGHTGMKNSAQWADYPAAAAWMMQHVWDHYDYSQDAAWLKSQGYPLIKGVAQFWLSQLQKDTHFNDGSLVVNPCNSPEHGPTTFACTHYQQLLYAVFDSTIQGGNLVGDDSTFIASVKTALTSLDKGLHIGTWGEVKEWKIADSLGYDFKNDTHRHLSNLVGWYPGNSISSFEGGYSNPTIQNAVATTLYSRGLGDASDANAGWEKVWRSACWARLNNTERAYTELKYAIDSNFANNGLSMYGGLSPPFQIDANFGLVGAMLSMLIVDLAASNTETSTHTVVLGPAIPSAWGTGSVKGVQLRGGGSVDFSWTSAGLVTQATLKGRSNTIKVVDKTGKVITSV